MSRTDVLLVVNRTTAPIALVLLAAGLAFACSACLMGDDDGEPSPTSATSEATTTATPENTPSPGGTRVPTPVPTSGVAIVDRFIKAMLTTDTAALPALVDYHDVACEVNPMGIGAPPACPPGVPAGTPVRAISGSSCEGYFITEPGAGKSLIDAAARGVNVYSASRVPEGGYAVILAPSGGGTAPASWLAITGAVYRLSDKGVISIAYGCGPSARTTSLLYPDYLIQPPPLAPVPPETPHSGIPAVDAIINAVVVRDIATLFARTKQVEVGCGTDWWLPYCGGQPLGTLIKTTEIHQCNDQLWFSQDGMFFDIDYQIGPAPKVVAVARRAEGGYAVIVDARIDPSQREGGHAIALDAAGQIVFFDRGCDETATQLAARFTEFIIAPQ